MNTVSVTSQPPKILIMIPTNDHGGCEYNALSFGKDLVENYQCEVYASFPLNDALEHMAALVMRSGMHFMPFEGSFVKSDNIDAVRAQQTEAWRIFDELRPDAVFIPLPWPKRGQGMIAACAGIGLPALIKFALVPEEWGSNEFVYEPCRKAIQSHRQTWFANSAYSADLLEKHFKLTPQTVDHFHVGPIGIHRLAGDDMAMANETVPMTREERLGLTNPDAFIVTTVARLSTQKGYPYLLTAAFNLWLANHVIGSPELGEGARKWAILLASMVGVEVLLGILNVMLHAPGWAQLSHLFTAQIIWISALLMGASALNHTSGTSITAR